MAMLAVDFTVFTQYIAGDIAGMAININFLVSQKLLLYYGKEKNKTIIYAINSIKYIIFYSCIKATL